MENPIKIDDLGGNTPIFGNTHIRLLLPASKVQIAKAKASKFREYLTKAMAPFDEGWKN